MISTENMPYMNLKLRIAGREHHNEVHALFPQTLARTQFCLDHLGKDPTPFFESADYQIDQKGVLRKAYNHDTRLHVYEGIIDVNQPHRLGLKEGWEIDFHDVGGNLRTLHLSSQKKKFAIGKISGRSRTFTLNGLYDGLPNDRMNTRYGAITDELVKHDAQAGLDFLGASISKRKDARLRLAEMQYRKYISDQ